MTTNVLDAIEAPELIVAKPRQKRAAKATAADPAVGVNRALEAIEKLQEQNAKAGNALNGLTTLWLSAASTRRRAEAVIALSHFDGALDILRKAMEAQLT